MDVYKIYWRDVEFGDRLSWSKSAKEAVLTRRSIRDSYDGLPHYLLAEPQILKVSIPMTPEGLVGWLNDNVMKG